MTTGSDIAKSGYKTEDLFSALIRENIEFNCAVKNFLKLEDGLELTAETLKGVQKGDVKLTISHRTSLEASVKSTKANFSQLDRRWLSSLISSMNVPVDISSKLNEGLDSMRLKQGAYQRLILPKYENDIIEYFQDNIKDFMNEMFTRQDDTVKLFVVYDNKNIVWYLLNMKDVIDFMSTKTVSVSNKGVLKFGDCVTMQRKGGDGNVTRVSKTDPTHPGNQLQIKVKPLTIVENLNPMIIMQK